MSTETREKMICLWWYLL